MSVWGAGVGPQSAPCGCRTEPPGSSLPSAGRHSVSAFVPGLRARPRAAGGVLRMCPPPPPRLPFCLEPRGQLGPTLKPRALPAFAAAGSPSVKDISKVAFSGPGDYKPRGGDREGRDVPVAAPRQHFRKITEQFFFFGEENLSLLKITEKARV